MPLFQLKSYVTSVNSSVFPLKFSDWYLFVKYNPYSECPSVVCYIKIEIL